MKVKDPPPGSEEARRVGCTCPVLDNSHGRGYMEGRTDKDGDLMFVITETCPIHWEEPKGGEGNGNAA